MRKKAFRIFRYLEVNKGKCMQNSGETQTLLMQKGHDTHSSCHAQSIWLQPLKGVVIGLFYSNFADLPIVRLYYGYALCWLLGVLAVNSKVSCT